MGQSNVNGNKEKLELANGVTHWLGLKKERLLEKCKNSLSYVKNIFLRNNISIC